MGTSKTVHSAARVALLAGVSATAFFAAGSANAQIVSPGTQTQLPPNYINNNVYGVGTSSNPLGVNAAGSNNSIITIPGITPVQAAPEALFSTATGAVVPTTTTGILNPDGTVKLTSYSTEIAGGATAIQGTGNNAGNVLVNATGVNAGALANPGGVDTTAQTPPPPGTKWVSVAAGDPSTQPYNWNSAIYNNDKTITATAYQQPNQSGQIWYVINGSGQPVPLGGANGFGAAFASLTAAQQGALNTAANTGNLAQFNSLLAADGLHFTVVSGNATDPKLANSSNYSFQTLSQAAVTQASDKSASTTAVPGGAIYQNNKGNYTTVGAGGVTVQDPKGNTSALTGGLLNLTNGANPKAGITLDATVDPVVTVTNGGGPLTVSRTVINNGSITSTEGLLNANAGSTNIDGSSVHASTPIGLSSNDVFLTGNGLRFNNTAGVDTIKMDTSTGSISTIGSLSVGNGMNVTGTATFNGTGANAGTTTTINGAVATLSGSKGTISLNANVDPILTVTNGLPGVLNSSTTINNGSITSNQGGASVGGTTVISGGSVAINGGPNNSNQGGNINTLAIAGNSSTGNPGALNVTGGAVINNGLEVNNGLRVTGPSQGQGFQTIDMGGNRVQDVGTPIFGTDAANKAYVDRGLNKAYEGTAIALAISQPIIGPNQTFAIRAGWGDYESQSAFGLSAAGIIGRDWFWGGSTVAIDGGVGLGTNNSVAGKAGITLAFGGGTPPVLPLK